MKYNYYSFLFLLILSLFSVSAVAATSFTPRVEVKEELISNKTSNADQSGNVLTLTPGFNYSVDAPRVKVDLDYGLNLIQSGGLSQDNEINQQLNLNSEVVHIPGRWQSQAFGRINQSNISADGILLTNPALQSNNSSEFRTLGVNTRLNGRWFKSLNYVAELNADVADNEAIQTSNGQGAKLSIDNYIQKSKINWKFDANSQQTTYQNADEKIDTLGFNIDYQFNPKISTFLEVTARNSGVKEIDDTSKLIGVKWTPDQRTSVRIGAGKRGSDNTYTLDATSRHRNTLLTARYSESVTTSRQNVLDTVQNDPTTTELVQNLSIQPILLKQSSIGMEVNGKRSSFSWSIFQKNKLDPVDSVNNEDTVGTRLGFSRRLSTRSTINLNLLSQETSTSLDNRVNDLSASWEMILSKKSMVKAEIRRTEQTSVLVANEYKQTSIGVTFNKMF